MLVELVTQEVFWLVMVFRLAWWHTGAALVMFWMARYSTSTRICNCIGMGIRIGIGTRNRNRSRGRITRGVEQEDLAVSLARQAHVRVVRCEGHRHCRRRGRAPHQLPPARLPLEQRARGRAA